ncbi:MAG: Com family DNA-binding transcriptional regulator [Candidatus Saganbacteria bacterium]|nr:Com family DNA-binding transcriptional regulator [Candidatus Saganbacteria bacterium]
MESTLQEFRCRACNRLLAKIQECRVVEIKCPKCKTINLYRDNDVVLVQIGPSYSASKDFKTTPNPDAIAN